MSILEVKNLSYNFKKNDGPFSAGTKKNIRQNIRQNILKDISFSIEEGSCLGLIGDSGSGKSTLARCIAGLLQPDSGNISILDSHVFPSTENRKSISGKVQLLYQDHTASLNPMMTIRDSLLEGIRARKKTILIMDSLIHSLLNDVGLLPDLLEKFPHQLSGGERQRVALARALSVHPALLVLDEPTSSLDIVTQIQILRLVKSIQRDKNTAVLFISHDIASVIQLCERIAVLYDGCIVECNTTESILANPQHHYTQQVVSLLTTP